MAEQSPQSFEKHAKWDPMFHFVLQPILLFNLIWRMYRLWIHFSEGHGRAEAVWGFLLAFAFILTAFFARTYALKAQDRVIRLEEYLRWQGLLTPEQYSRKDQVGRRFLIALRFAPDVELPGLYTRVLSGELKDPKEVKRAIKNWRQDNHRL